MLQFSLHGVASNGRLTAIARVDGADVTSETYIPGSGRDRQRIAVAWASDPRLCNGDGNRKAAVAAIIQQLERLELQVYQADNDPDTPRSKLAAVRASDVLVEPVTWLWPGRLACGKLNFIAGDPDTGKTFLTLDIASRATKGDVWPDDPNPYAQPRDVVIVSAEDDPGDTLVPRLQAMGADLSRVHLVAHAELNDGSRDGLLLERDLGAIESLIADTGAVLCVLDPLGALLGKLDTHQNSQVRGVLFPLAEMAARQRVCVVCVHHLNKAYGGKAIYRSSGSLAFTAAARCVHLCCHDKDDESEDEADRRKLFLPVKMNIARRPPGLSYRLTADLTVAWGTGTVATTADEAIAETGRPGPKPESHDEAAEFLAEVLADGPVPSTELYAEAETRGIAKRTLFRAKENLGVGTRRVGKGWAWVLPDREVCQTHIMADMANMADMGSVAERT